MTRKSVKEKTLQAIYDTEKERTFKVLKNGYCNCGSPGEDSHICPFGQEINNSDAECNCCDICQRNCADDI